MGVKKMRSPSNWQIDGDVSKDQIEEATKLLTSLRGKYLIGRALYTLLIKLDSVDSPYREASDIRDLKFIRDTLFSEFPPEVYETQDLVTESDIRRRPTIVGEGRLD